MMLVFALVVLIALKVNKIEFYLINILNQLKPFTKKILKSLTMTPAGDKHSL